MDGEAGEYRERALRIQIPGPGKLKLSWAGEGGASEAPWRRKRRRRGGDSSQSTAWDCPGPSYWAAGARAERAGAWGRQEKAKRTG